MSNQIKMKETKENLGAGKDKVVEAKGDNEAPAMGGKKSGYVGFFHLTF